MAYVVVVSSLINVLALLAVAYFFWGSIQDIPTIVESAIQDEVRRQDDRIEKRAQRAGGQTEDTVPTAVDGVSKTGLRPGEPYRRG